MSSSDSDARSSSRRKSSERSRSRDRDRKYLENREKKIKMKVPDLSTNLYNFKQFTLLQTEKVSQETIQRGYDKYKRDWEHRQGQEFVNTCKNDAWFNEKYNPELLDLQEREKRDLAKKNYQEFEAKVNSGAYDDIEFRVSDLSKIGSVYEQEEDEDQNQNFGSFLSNQTIEVILDNSIDIKKAPYCGFDPDHATLFIKGLSRQISRYDIKAALVEIEGWKTITMSDPLRKANFGRNCWIEFFNEDQCHKASLLFNGIMIKDTTITVSKAYTKFKKLKILKNYPSTRLETDIQSMIKLANKLDAKIGITQNTILIKKYPTPQKFFDTLQLYLRRIHYFDFYTCNQYDNERMLTLRTGSIFMRVEENYEELPNTQTVFKKIHENIEKKIDEIKETPEYMVAVREEVERFIRETQKVGKDAVKDIWKCQFCEKKFKTCEFLAKHIITRHEDIKLKKIQTVMEQLYNKDPSKITNYYIRDDSKPRKNFNGGFRRERRRDFYRDYDEPENEAVAKPSTASKGMVNFLDI